MKPKAQSKAAQKNKRTISEELHEQWKLHRRIGDCDALAALLKVSKPTIDNALIYGAVHQQKLVDGITKFFKDRLLKEQGDAQELQQLGEGKKEVPSEV